MAESQSITRVRRQHEPATSNGTTTTAGRDVYLPAADIIETKDAFVLWLDVPGVDEGSVELMLEDNQLTVAGRSMVTAPEGYSPAYREFEPGDYQRRFTLPKTVDRDAIEAAIKDGVLRVSLPKAEPAKAKKITVNASKST